MISGDVFKRIRLSRGLSQKDIADYVNKTKQMVSAYENNIDMPSEEVYEKMIKGVYSIQKTK